MGASVERKHPLAQVLSLLLVAKPEQREAACTEIYFQEQRPGWEN